MRNPRYCFQCDDGTVLVHTQKDIVIQLGDQSETVPAVNGWHCPVCGECEFDDAGEAERVSVASDAMVHQQRAKRAAAIRATRKRLKLSQKEAAALFGGGVNAFSEYERGVTQPHRSTVMLLALLDRHPELLEEVKQSA